MEMMIVLPLIIAMFYFMMIRPEQKRKKKAAELRDSLTVGDEITTIGGMVGKIVQVRDEFVTFETGEDRVRIRIAKWAISTKGKAKEEQPDQPQQS